MLNNIQQIISMKDHQIKAMKRTEDVRVGSITDRVGHVSRQGDSGEEFDVVISPDGTVTFSWNLPCIQEMAMLLGIPEPENPVWCG